MFPFPRRTELNKKKIDLIKLIKRLINLSMVQEFEQNKKHNINKLAINITSIYNRQQKVANSNNESDKMNI